MLSRVDRNMKYTLTAHKERERQVRLWTNVLSKELNDATSLHFVICEKNTVFPLSFL